MKESRKSICSHQFLKSERISIPKPFIILIPIIYWFEYPLKDQHYLLTVNGMVANPRLKIHTLCMMYPFLYFFYLKSIYKCASHIR